VLPYFHVRQPPLASQSKKKGGGGRQRGVDAAVLHLMKEIHANGTPITQQAM
jgi:hypothetical protein